MVEEHKDQPVTKPNDDLGNLADRLEKARSGQKRHSDDVPPSAMALGMKYAIEFTAAVLVGAALGYLLDRFASTAPWGLVAGLFFGMAAGIREIIRSAQKDMNTPP